MSQKKHDREHFAWEHPSSLLCGRRVEEILKISDLIFNFCRRRKKNEFREAGTLRIGKKAKLRIPSVLNKFKLAESRTPCPPPLIAPLVEMA